jgi:allantoicase
MFYGSPQKMLMPGLAASMGDGWETSRRRDDSNDWVIVKLAVPAVIGHADLDTSHFKGNAPGRATLRAVDTRAGALDDPADWFELMPSTPLAPDTPHRFRLDPAAAATHVRMDIFPDGGMARLRLHGRPDAAGAAALRSRFESLSKA